MIRNRDWAVVRRHPSSEVKHESRTPYRRVQSAAGQRRHRRDLGSTSWDHTVLLRYLNSPFEPALVGTQNRCSEDEVTGFYEGDDLGHTTGQPA